MNVLSLFDGISCGQLALQRSNIKFDNYFASEINNSAIKITQQNHPNTIQIGNVCDINPTNLPKIDLLIGGSPCQGFSFAGKQLNFEDVRSKLFFEYERILRQIKIINPEIKFLLENVVMKKKYQDIISSYLNVSPIMIDSKLVSAQNRKRLYWTNIPNVGLPTDKNIKLNDILEYGKCIKDKSYCLLETYSHQGILPCNIKRFLTKSMHHLIKDESKEYGYRKLTCVETERLQTLPDDYTKGLSLKERYSLIGNCWTVDVLTHIFSFIK